MVQVTRSFAKRATEKSEWDGQVSGDVVLEVTGKNISFAVNGKVLPDASVQYLLNFSLQSLQDAYAGAKSIDEAKANFQKRLDGLLAGSIGIREGGGVSEEIRIRRQFVMDVVREAARKKEGKPWKDTDKKAELDALDEATLNAKLDAGYEKQVAHFEPLVKAKLAELEAARRARKQARGVEVDIEI